MPTQRKTGLFASADRITIALHPAMVVCCVIGVLCGLTLAGMGAAHTFGWIDVGSLADEISPKALMGLGALMAFGAFGGIFKCRELREEALVRLELTTSPHRDGEEGQ